MTRGLYVALHARQPGPTGGLQARHNALLLLAGQAPAETPLSPARGSGSGSGSGTGSYVCVCRRREENIEELQFCDVLVAPRNACQEVPPALLLLQQALV
jgi:hypothetical protein